MVGHAGCRVADSPRWQPNYTNHFNGCRAGPEAHLQAELAARNIHLIECGAITAHDSPRAAETDTAVALSSANDTEPPPAPAAGHPASAASKPGPAPSPETGSQSSAATEVDTGKVQPLDLRPGCWEVYRRVSIAVSAPSPEAIKKTEQTIDDSIRKSIEDLEKNPNLTPAQRAQSIAAAKAMADGMKQAGAGAAGESAGDSPAEIFCTQTPFLDEGKDVYGTRSGACARTIDGRQARHMRVVCPNRTSDYERKDSETFEATTRGEQVGADTRKYTQTVSTTGKWVGEASPHMPYPVPRTDLNGVRPRGPYAIAWLDRYRIVAVIDDKPIVAIHAYYLLSMIPSGASEQYGPRLSDVLQQMYMHDAIAVEAVKLGLGPWDNASLCTGSLGWIHCGPQADFPGLERAVMFGETSPPESISSRKMQMLASSLHGSSDAYQGAVERLWKAYFKQAKTNEEQLALLETVKQKYRITATDPDFFDREHAPGTAERAR